MRHVRLVLVLIALVVIFPSFTEGGRHPKVADEQLRFSLQDLDGNAVTSGDERFRGKVLLIDIWGTWCPPCLTEIPTFNDLQARYGEQGLIVVGMAFERIADDGERREHLRQFVREHKISYLVLDGGDIQDFETILPDLQDVKGFPIEITVGRDGTVVETRNSSGYTKRWARKLERRLSALLGPSPKPD